MELGDSVYAAERIMKKRIRKVSLLLLRKRTQHIFWPCETVEITYHPPIYLVRFAVNCLFCNNALPASKHNKLIYCFVGEIGIVHGCFNSDFVFLIHTLCSKSSCSEIIARIFGFLYNACFRPLLLS